MTKWVTSGSGDGQFGRPSAVAVDSSDNVYVLENSKSRIQKLTSEGVFLTKWGTLGSGDGQFYGPLGVTVDGSGNVFVVDTGNRRIQKFGSLKISAVIDINPNVFNLKSKGNYITCYIELDIESEYDVYDIDQTLDIFLDSIVPAEASPREIADSDGNGILDLMVKFDRQAIYEDIVLPDEVELFVTGSLIDGLKFEGSDIILVKDVGKDHTNDSDPSSVEY